MEGLMFSDGRQLYPASASQMTCLCSQRPQRLSQRWVWCPHSLHIPHTTVLCAPALPLLTRPVPFRTVPVPGHPAQPVSWGKPPRSPACTLSCASPSWDASAWSVLASSCPTGVPVVTADQKTTPGQAPGTSLFPSHHCSAQHLPCR